MLKDKRLLYLALLLCSMVSLPAGGESREAVRILFLLSEPGGIYEKVAEQSTQALSERNPGRIESKVMTVGDANIGADLVVSIGTRAAAEAYQRYPNNPSVNTLLTRSAHRSLEAVREPASVPLFLDQPVSHYLALGLSLVPDAQRVGILVGPAGKEHSDAIKAAARDYGLEPILAFIDEKSNPVKVIEPAMAAGDFFVVLPDHLSINRAAAKWVLQLSFRHRKPVIAYSRKYAQAGALAAVYRTPEDISAELVDVLDRYLRSGELAAQPNNHFSVETNATVARSLGISLADKKRYREDIGHRLEAPR